MPDLASHPQHTGRLQQSTTWTGVCSWLVPHKTQNICALRKTKNGVKAHVSPPHLPIPWSPLPPFTVLAPGIPNKGAYPNLPNARQSLSAHQGCSSHIGLRWLAAPAPRPPPAQLQSPHTPGRERPGTGWGRKIGLACFCSIAPDLISTSFTFCYLPATRTRKTDPQGL